MKINRLVLFVVLICTTFALNAQEQHRIEDKGAVVGVKTNIPYWGTATFNAEVEVRLAKKWTLELEAGLNPFDGKKDDGSYGRSLKHLRLHPELRYWFCESFHKHFLGLHIPYLLYNVSDVKLLGVENERSQGWGTGVGFSYGYQWLQSKHWNLEATVGVGYLYLDYDKSPCANCGYKIESGHKHYFGPTQAAISIMYLF